MVIIVIMLVFGVIGGLWAKSKGLSPWLWGIVCGLFPLFGLIVLAFQKPVVAR